MQHQPGHRSGLAKIWLLHYSSSYSGKRKEAWSDESADFRSISVASSKIKKYSMKRYGGI